MPVPQNETAVGQSALIAKFGLRVPAPAVTSIIHAGARRTIVDNDRSTERYPTSYRPEDTLVGHLKFALRYEPLHLGILAATYRACDAGEMEAWVRAEPNGAYSRRAWFFYEWLTGKPLDLPDAGIVKSVDALKTEFHFTARGLPSRRHRVTDNVAGIPGFAPTLRRTKPLEDSVKANLQLEVETMTANCDPAILARAVNYLYTKETKSSFEIEREVATGPREERFVKALRETLAFDPTKLDDLIRLQNSFVDPRYAAQGLRDFQNFVGAGVDFYNEVVNFICPKPRDVGPLIAAWSDMTKRLSGAFDPVLAATLVAFGFVFIHPFEDGNGRIHRYLIHHVLSSEGFTPPDVLFPVSAAILRDSQGYDRALETFSGSIKPFIDWNWGPKRTIAVENETADLYRYFDATPLAEFLYAKVADTIRVDLKGQLEFVAVFDAATKAVREIVDMPDRRASLLVRLCLQNGGRLSKKKRSEFEELTDEEVAAIGDAIAEVQAVKAVSPEAAVEPGEGV